MGLGHSPRRLSRVVALSLFSSALEIHAQSGPPSSPSAASPPPPASSAPDPIAPWAAQCVARLERARDELRAISPRLAAVTIEAAPNSVSRARPDPASRSIVFFQGERGSLFAVVEDWIPPTGHDLGWDDAGFGECPDPREVRLHWQAHHVHNYANGRQAQLQFHGLPARWRNAIFSIVTRALDDCAAM